MKLTELLALVETRTWGQANVEALHPAFYEAESLALAPDMHIHRSAFCSFAKRHGRDACFRNKRRSLDLAVYGRCFSGACPFGIWEFAQPVMHCGELAAVVYLGGFRNSAWRPSLESAAYDGAPPRELYPGALETIREEAAFIAKFISFELALWSAGRGPSRKRRPQSFYRDFCLQFIARNYQEDIGLEDLASVLKVTPNFLSYRVRSACGRSFSELLTERRLDAASRLLEFSGSLSVMDVAFSCGFRDANYFSAVFHRSKGVSPRDYRRRAAEKTLPS